MLLIEVMDGKQLLPNTIESVTKFCNGNIQEVKCYPLQDEFIVEFTDYMGDFKLARVGQWILKTSIGFMLADNRHVQSIILNRINDHDKSDKSDK